MKQRNLALAIAILSTIIVLAGILLVAYLGSSRTEYIGGSANPLFYISSTRVVYDVPGLLYAAIGLAVPAVFINFILGIVLLASRSERTFKASGLVTATGVLAIIGVIISGIPTMIVAFITYAKLNKEIAQPAAAA